MKLWRRRGLRFKIALGVFFVLVMLLGAVVLVVILAFGDQLLKNEGDLALLRNRLFVTQVQDQMTAGNWSSVTETAWLFGQENPEYQVEDVAIFARSEAASAADTARIVMAVYSSGFPRGRTIDRSVVEKEPYSQGCRECHESRITSEAAFVDIPLKARPADPSGPRVLRTAVAIKNEVACQACHSADQDVLGMSLIDFRLDNYNTSLRDAAIRLAAGGAGTILLVMLALYLLVNALALKPLRTVVASTQAVAKGQWDEQVPVRSEDEIGKLGSAFNEMTAQLSTTYAELQLTLRQSEEQADALQRALDDVQRGQAEQSRLVSTIRQMSVPVVPVHRGVLVTPLVGIIDEDRAERIIEALLSTVENQRARIVIMDITGVPMVDTAVAQTLLQAAQSVRLLGAEAVLVGITPQVAETIVSLGVDLAGLVTRADLQSGVEYALKRLAK